MAKKSKLNTNLDRSARKIRTKKSESDEKYSEEMEPTPEEIAKKAESDDDATYTMGDILSSDHDDEPEHEVKKPPTETNEGDDDEEWVDEEVNLKDEDPYLDMEDFDLDNPEDDDSY